MRRKSENTKSLRLLKTHCEIDSGSLACQGGAVSTERLVVFVKAPRAGQVKTRIAETAGPERAREIYLRLVKQVVESMRALQNVELRFSPDDAGAEVQPWLQGGWTASAQGEGDLGERLHRAFSDAFAAGAERVVIIGSDCPEVRTADVRTAWRELKSHDIVVGPAVDGGYWLIGLSAPQPDLFKGIAWSSDQVLGETLARAKSLKLRIQLLRILTDIDTEEDWNVYVREHELS